MRNISENIHRLTDSDLHTAYKQCDESKYPEKAIALRQEVIRRAQLRRNKANTSKNNNQNTELLRQRADNKRYSTANKLSVSEKSRTSHIAETIPPKKSTNLDDNEEKSYSRYRVANRTTPYQPDNLLSDEHDHAKKPQSGWMIKHWKGELSLVKSFWINGILLGILLTVLLLYLNHKIGISDATGTQRGAFVLFNQLFATVFVVWQIVGIFRSARRHRLRGGQAFWAYVVYLWTILSVTQFTLNMTQSGIPLIQDGIQLISGKSSLPDYRIKLLNNNTEIEFAGGIRFSASESLRKVLDANPRIATLHLNSVGGRLAEAQKMAKLVEDYRLDTLVVNRCDSSCPIVFLAGQRRMLGENAHIGFHSASIAGVSGNTNPFFNAPLAQALREAGMSDTFINQVISVDSSTMWYPTKDELKSEAIFDIEVSSAEFGRSGLPESWGIADVEEELKTDPYFRAIAVADRPSFQQVTDMVLNDGINGVPYHQTNTKLSHYLRNDRMKHYQTYASDNALHAYISEFMKNLSQLLMVDPKLCAMISFPKDFTDQELNTVRVPMQYRVSEFTTTELIRSVSHANTILSDEAFQKAAIDIVTSFNEQHPQYENIFGERKNPYNYQDNCAANIAFNKIILELGPKTAGPIFRTIGRR